MSHGVYVEHPKRAMIEGLAFGHGCDHVVTKCSGQWYMFPTKEQAIGFVWRLRNMPTRYVEIDGDLEEDLKQFVIKKGFSGDLTGLVSKILQYTEDAKVKTKKAVKRKTIMFSTLKRLSFCNSKKLPQRIVHDGVVKEWVGIGWITLENEKPKPNDVYVVED